MCDVLTTCLVFLWSGLSHCLGDWWVSGIYWLEKKRGEKKREGHWEVCLGEGGYDRLSNSLQDTSHTSLVGSGKENGSYVSVKAPPHTQTHTYTHRHWYTHFYPNYPYAVPWADGWVMLTGTPLESGESQKGKKESGRRKVMEGWKLGEFREGRRTEEGE